MWRRIRFGAFIVSIVLGVGVGAYLIKLFYDVETEVSKIKEYRFALASQIVDRKDRLIANIFTDENFRFYATFDEIPPRVIELLLEWRIHYFLNISALIPMRFLVLCLRILKVCVMLRGEAHSPSSLLKISL